MDSISLTQVLATICFALAVIHTFLVSQFQHAATRYETGSTGENFFHLMGEVEISFGLWAAVYLGLVSVFSGSEAASDYLNSRDFTEAVFVFVIMAVCSTKPVLEFAKATIRIVSHFLPFSPMRSLYVTTMTLGPLLGSLITEPAAMTVTALILLDSFYRRGLSRRFMYGTLGLLFVSVSIGGTLTPYAAPPVLMVAAKWNWDLMHMLTHFGWKAALATLLGAIAMSWAFRKELSALDVNAEGQKLEKEPGVPIWVTILHLAFLGVIVMNHHDIPLFMGAFLFFLGLFSVTQEYQKELRLRGGLLVAFFLGGIVVLGEPQRWWLEPLLGRLNASALYTGAIGLTAITDNAALAYLGSQIDLSESSRYALIAGSVVGGGLTVIANAPNPVGFGLLNSSFGDDGISPARLFLAALPFTFLAGVIFWLA